MHRIPPHSRPPLTAEERLNMFAWLMGAAVAYLLLGLASAQTLDGWYSSIAFVLGPPLLLALLVIVFVVFQILVFVAESYNGYSKD